MRKVEKSDKLSPYKIVDLIHRPVLQQAQLHGSGKNMRPRQDYHPSVRVEGNRSEQPKTFLFM